MSLTTGSSSLNKVHLPLFVIFHVIFLPCFFITPLIRYLPRHLPPLYLQPSSFSSVPSSVLLFSFLSHCFHLYQSCLQHTTRWSRRYFVFSVHLDLFGSLHAFSNWLHCYLEYYLTLFSDRSVSHLGFGQD
uniref:Uncharacterized protein n=1 Tax=Cacopsylla melanoneura TaxID=428564 RepID=A0A8D9A999_9HEMI